MAVPGFRGWPRCLPIFCPSPHTAQFGLTGNYQSSGSKKTKHAQTARGLHASQLCGETPTVSQLIWLTIVRFRFRLAQSTPKRRAHPMRSALESFSNMQKCPGDVCFCTNSYNGYGAFMSTPLNAEDQ